MVSHPHPRGAFNPKLCRIIRLTEVLAPIILLNDGFLIPNFIHISPKKFLTLKKNVYNIKVTKSIIMDNYFILILLCLVTLVIYDIIIFRQMGVRECIITCLLIILFFMRGREVLKVSAGVKKSSPSVKIRSPTKAIGMQHILRILNPEAAELINPNKKRRSSPTKKTFVGFFLYKIPNFIYRQT